MSYRGNDDDGDWRSRDVDAYRNRRLRDGGVFERASA
jgi:hypothetical protein